MKLSPQQDGLVQGLLDGALDPADRAAAERLLAANEDARQRSSALTALATALDALGTTEPPAGFTAGVMEQIRDSAMTRTAPAGSRPGVVSGSMAFLRDGGLVMGKKLMWGLAAAAALTLVIMKFTGYPPIDGAQGTIGAAKRYQAPQIASSDVQVDDSAQAFLQTDTFDQLLKDADARQMLASPSFRSALAAPEFRQALASPEFRSALASPEMRQALASPEFRSALAAPELRQAMASPEFSKALASPGLRALASPDFFKALASPGFGKALGSPEFSKVLAAPGFAKALASPGFLHALNSPGFSKALASPQMAQALAMVGR